jgi:predicted nucleotidyltransferase
MNDISDIKQELDEIIKIIKDTVPVESIYLFGSYAYGIPHKDSDLDFFIVFKDEMQIRILEAIRSIYKAIDPFRKKPVDFIGLKQDRFLYKKNYATIERKIAREGIKLYGG